MFAVMHSCDEHEAMIDVVMDDLWKLRGARRLTDAAMLEWAAQVAPEPAVEGWVLFG